MPRELSWSLSKARTFEACPRRYYYQYYLAAQKYPADAPEEVRLACEMKRIKGLDMWAGEVVHRAVESALTSARDGVPPSAEQVGAEARRMLSDGWRSSSREEWRTHDGDEYPCLFEHFYGMEVPRDATDRIKNKVLASIGNLVSSELFSRIAATPADRWLPVEKYSAFRIDGLLFYLKYDFALRDGAGVAIYDWKTGKPSPEEMRQLSCYAMFGSEKWGIPLGNIQVLAVHLFPELDVQSGEPDADDLRAYVRGSFGAMIECLRDPARNIAVMEDFPQTENLAVCNWCSFRGICDGAKRESGEASPTDWEDQ
ncbi:MAG: PD-(D/E)XK nuclease family protein [Armatimonadota bacterium]